MTIAPPTREHVQPGRTMRVSSTSDPNAVGGAIAHAFRRDGHAEISVIGAGALNQAIKSVAVATLYLSEDDIAVALVPSFETVTLPDDRGETTAIRLRVVPRGIDADTLSRALTERLRLNPSIRDLSDRMLADVVANEVVQILGG